MIRKAFIMWVKPEAQAEYKKRHDALWPELAATLKAQGAHNYAIYLDAERSTLFATVEIESEERWAAVADTPICRKWWAFMAEIMPSNPDNSPKAVELKEVFFLA